MTKLEIFLEERASKQAELKVRMSGAYKRNEKVIKRRKQSSQKRIQNEYKKWAKVNQIEVKEEMLTPNFLSKLKEYFN
tara:strand:- start:1035 stop:1268 length:234 start_codon:yes stop_codon:yes gene_type:complete